MSVFLSDLYQTLHDVSPYLQKNLSKEEQDLYTEWLSKVEVAYSLLHVSKTN